MAEDAVSQFLRAAGRVPLLTPSQEITMGTAVQAWLTAAEPTPAVIRRGQRARQRMVEANLRLVMAVAKRFRCPPGMELQDLLQEGCIGLAKAVERFDPTAGYKFSTYAYWWIRQSIGRAIQTQRSVIRVPVNAWETDAGQAALGGMVPLDSTARADSDTSLHELIAAPAEVDPLHLAAEALEAVMQELGELAPAALVKAEKTGRRRETLERVGEEMGVSREIVRQRLRVQLAELRHLPAVVEVLAG